MDIPGKYELSAPYVNYMTDLKFNVYLDLSFLGFSQVSSLCNDLN